MKRINTLLLLASLTFAGNAGAQIDANKYLDMLEAEGEIEAPAEHLPTHSELINKAPGTPAVHQYIAFKNTREFESYLSQNMRGTWMFFNKLDAAGKQLVFNNYRKKRNLNEVSHMIQQVYKMTR